MSHRKRGVADLKFIKSENKSVPEICAVYKRNNLLKDGYKKTAKTNLFLAEMCLEADNEALSACV